MKKFYTFLFAIAFSAAVNAQIISTVAGIGTAGFSGDGNQATAAQINSPLGIVVDQDGVMYIADGGNNRIRKVDTAGVITTIAGTGTPGYSGDNGAATSAKMDNPAGLALDANGDLFIADYSNHRIRKIDLTTGIITTVAGNGVSGFAGDGSAATSASLNYPTGVCFDVTGNMFIADQGNYRVRKVAYLTNIISTAAGNGTTTINGIGGPATAAGVGHPYDVKTDLLGNIIFSTVAEHYIFKVTLATGNVTSICGNGTPTFSGDGGPSASATLVTPEGIAIDGAGNIFIAELNSARIRRIDAVTGIISTIAGSGSFSYSGDGGPATSAGLWPDAVAVSGTDLYIVDLNNRIRKVTNSAMVGIESQTVNAALVSLFPNPANESFSVSGIAPNTPMQIFDMNGSLVFSEAVNENETINISGFAQGVYIVFADKKKIKLVKM